MKTTNRCLCYLSLICLLPVVVQQALAYDKFLYYSIDPMVLQEGDTLTTLTVEVATTGADIVKVTMEYPEEIVLLDDGTHGDRVAGDGIYTRNDIAPQISGKLIPSVNYGRTGPDVFVETTGGNSESMWLPFGLVREGWHRPAVRLDDGFYATGHAFYLEDAEGLLLDTPEWPLGDIKCGKENFEATQRFYSVLEDNFDFIIVMPAHTIFDPARNYAENVPYFVRAKNDVQHIGIPLFDETALFGSAGRLKGMIYHSWGTGAILDHEIGHAWCADLGETLGLTRCATCYGNHWNPLSDIGGQMCAFFFHPEATLGAGHLMNNGDGSWRIEREPGDNNVFTPLDLYAMGLLPPDEVPPVHILVNPDSTDHTHVTADTVITITIDDIIAAEGGERIPPAGEAQTDFKTAFVVIKNAPFTAAEFTFYSLISEFFASEAQGSESLTTFYTATGGRGRLDARTGIDTAVRQDRLSPGDFWLFQNYPNPFNPQTTIRFNLKTARHVRLTITGIDGRVLSTLIDGKMPAGPHEIHWQAEDYPSGIYLCQLQSEGRLQTIKLTVQR